MTLFEMRTALRISKKIIPQYRKQGQLPCTGFLTGFTLIEVLIYLGIFAIIISGAFVSIYYIIESNHQTAKLITVQEEGNFLLRKLDWALTNATAINQPAAGETGPVLALTVPTLPPADNPLVFSLAAKTMRLRRGAGSSISLSTPNVSIDNLQVTHVPATSAKPAALTIRFTANEQPFQLTKYLRQ